jgi:hypothetical protein
MSCSPIPTTDVAEIRIAPHAAATEGRPTRLGRDVLLGRIDADTAVALALGRCDGPNGRPVYGQPSGRRRRGR